MANPSDRTPNPYDIDSWFDAPDDYPDEYADFALHESMLDESILGEFEQELFGEDDFAAREPRISQDGPSLPIILLSAACGIAAAIIGAYLARFILHLNAPFSAAIGTLSMLGMMAAVAIALSRLVESRATTANIGMSCGLMLFTLLFFGICTIAGAFTATFILTLGR